MKSSKIRTHLCLNSDTARVSHEDSFFTHVVHMGLDLKKVRHITAKLKRFRGRMSALTESQKNDFLRICKNYVFQDWAPMSGANVSWDDMEPKEYRDAMIALYWELDALEEAWTDL